MRRKIARKRRPYFLRRRLEAAALAFLAIPLPRR